MQLKLSVLAARQGRASEELVQEAIERLVDYDGWFLAEVEKGLAQIDSGKTLSHKELVTQLLDGDLLTTKEAAALVRVSPWTISAWLSQGKLPRVKAGGRTLIARTALQAFVNRSSKPAPSGADVESNGADQDCTPDPTSRCCLQTESH